MFYPSVPTVAQGHGLYNHTHNACYVMVYKFTHASGSHAPEHTREIYCIRTGYSPSLCTPDLSHSYG